MAPDEIDTHKSEIPGTFSFCKCFIEHMSLNVDITSFNCHVSRNCICLPTSSKPATHHLSIPWKKNVYLLELYTVEATRTTEFDVITRCLTTAERETCKISVLNRLLHIIQNHENEFGILRALNTVFVTSHFIARYADEYVRTNKLRKLAYVTSSKTCRKSI